MSHKEKLEVSIRAKEKGVIDSFITGYTMREHFDGLPLRHGKSVAEYAHGLKDGDYIILVSPVSDSSLDNKIANFLGVDGVTKGQFVLEKIMNPLHSSNKSYQFHEIDGEQFAISSEYSFGWRYGKIVTKWVKEAGENSFISLPECP